MENAASVFGPGKGSRTADLKRGALAGLLRSEWFLAIGAGTSALLLFRGTAFDRELALPLGQMLFCIWLLMAAFGCCLSVVRHAEHLALRLGEPYGTLVLTLAVTMIEVVSISSAMMHGDHNQALARDTIFSVIMILLNGMVGLSLLLGGWRHLEQHFNLLGANTYVGMIIPLTVFSLILPNHTITTPGPTLSSAQEGFVALVSIGLYGVFLCVQTLRHRAYFRSGDANEGDDHEPPTGVQRHPIVHATLLVSYMAPLIFLAERLATPVDAVLATLHAPAALGGGIVALLVTTPEALSAIRAATANRLQRSMNILLGSVLSTIGLTIPAMIALSHFQGLKIVLGLQSGNAIMLCLSLAVSLVTFASGRTNILHGAIHLVLFCAYIMLIFEG